MSCTDPAPSRDLDREFAQVLGHVPGGELALNWKERAHPALSTLDFMERMLVMGLQGRQALTDQAVWDLISEIFPDVQDQLQILKILIAAGYLDQQHQFTQKARAFLFTDSKA